MHVLEKHVVWKGLLEKSAPQRYNSIEFSYPANVRIGLIRRMEAVKRIQLPCGLLFPLYKAMLEEAKSLKLLICYPPHYDNIHQPTICHKNTIHGHYHTRSIFSTHLLDTFISPPLHLLPSCSSGGKYPRL